jgi:hypothetical protein
MPEFSAWLAALLTPVLFLMFVALRTRRRRAYPHGLLAPSRRNTAASLLLRSFRLFFDSLIDALAALLIALALSGAGPRAAGKSAVALDCSRSMLWGTAGGRALDEAALWLYANAPDAELFLLSADYASGAPVLRKAGRLRRESAGPAELVARLEASEPFLGLDYALLSTLATRGYSDLTLLTDELGPEAAGFRAIEFGWRQARALYPVSARVEPEGAYLRWLALGGAVPLALYGLGRGGILTEAEASGWAISAEPDGFTLFLREAGEYLLRWDGGELAFRAPAPPGLSAKGALASQLAPLLAAPDAGKSEAGRLSLRDGGGRSRPGSLSLARSGEENLVMAPWRVMGQAVAAGFDARADLALGPAAFASAEAALALWTAWQARAEDFVDLRASGAGTVGAQSRLGESVALLGPGPREAAPLMALLAPPPEEYWEPLPGAVIDAGARRGGRLPAALALALLYGLKLYLSKRLRS